MMRSFLLLGKYIRTGIVGAAAWLSPVSTTVHAQGGAAPNPAGADIRGQDSATGEAPLLPLRFLLGASVAHDSNVLRLPETAPDPLTSGGESGKADRYATALLGVRFDREYSQQTFNVQLDKRIFRYDRFGLLDRDELSYAAAWRGRLGGRLDVALLAARTERLVGVEETLARSNNVRVDTSRDATLGITIVEAWRAVVGASELESRNSVPSPEQPSNRQTGGQLGLIFQSPAGSSIAATWRSRRGTNTDDVETILNLIDTRFRVDERELALNWIPGPVHTLRGRFTRIEYRYDNLAQRNFAGNTAEAVYDWRPTGRLLVTASATRSVAPWVADATASYRVDEVLALAPSWTISEKSALAARLSRAESDYRGALVAGPSVGRRDSVGIAELTASWVPKLSTEVRARLRRERRTSSDARFDYEATVAELSATLTF